MNDFVSYINIDERQIQVQICGDLYTITPICLSGNTILLTSYGDEITEKQNGEIFVDYRPYGNNPRSYHRAKRFDEVYEKAKELRKKLLQKTYAAKKGWHVHVHLTEIEPDAEDECMGIYKTKREAEEAAKKIAQECLSKVNVYRCTLRTVSYYLDEMDDTELEEFMKWVNRV